MADEDKPPPAEEPAAPTEAAAAPEEKAAEEAPAAAAPAPAPAPSVATDNFVSAAPPADGGGGADLGLPFEDESAEPEEHIPLMQRVPNLCPPLTELCVEVVAANFKGMIAAPSAPGCSPPPHSSRFCDLPLADLCRPSPPFVDNQNFAAIPAEFQTRVVEILPTDLPLAVTASQIQDDYYWERCSTERCVGLFSPTVGRLRRRPRPPSGRRSCSPKTTCDPSAAGPGGRTAR